MGRKRKKIVQSVNDITVRRHVCIYKREKSDDVVSRAPSEE